MTLAYHLRRYDKTTELAGVEVGIRQHPGLARCSRGTVPSVRAACPAHNWSCIHASACNPLRSTNSSSFSAGADGDLVPCSHAATVAGPTFNTAANAA
jgi:hypothetical protein